MLHKTEHAVSEKQLRKRAAISFITFGILCAAAIAGWFYFLSLPRNTEAGKGTRIPVRTMLQMNEGIFKSLFNNGSHTAEFSKAEAANPARVNGNIGMGMPTDTATWILHLVRASGDTLNITMEDIKQLPKQEEVFNFKCIEGWSQVTYWGGVRFSDFLKHYHLDKEADMNYLGLSTPGNEYYVGIDMKSALHPQTLLCYELNGKPLPLNQGYPLRLIIPVKYGIKHLKHLGTMQFSNSKPPDYWAERGYDYYSGL